MSLVIPRIIHQTWFGWDGRWEDKSWALNSVNSINFHMPKWQYIILDEEGVGKIVKSRVPELYSFWCNLPYPVMRSDFGRYASLYAFGGFYMDMDMCALKSFAPLRHPENGLLFYDYAKNGRRYEIDFIGSSPRNPFWLDLMRECVRNYAEKAAIEQYKTWRGRFVMQTTGPYFFDRAMKRLHPVHTRLPLVRCDELGLKGEYVVNHSAHSWQAEGVGLPSVQRKTPRQSGGRKGEKS